MQSKATTVSQYIAELPPDRKAAILAVREVIRANVDADIEECMQYGMIGFVVPHSVYPPGYHCDPKLPLGYLALASQKQYMSLYLGSVYCGCGEDEDPGDNPDALWFRERWARTGKKLDMGRSCIRFKKLDDLALDVIADAIKRVPTRAHIAHYEAGLAASGISHPGKQAKPAAKPATKKTPASKTSARKVPARKTPAKSTTRTAPA
jgi:hypothetical protein